MLAGKRDPGVKRGKEKEVFVHCCSEIKQSPDLLCKAEVCGSRQQTLSVCSSLTALGAVISRKTQASPTYFNRLLLYLRSFQSCCGGISKVPLSFKDFWGTKRMKWQTSHYLNRSAVMSWESPASEGHSSKVYPGNTWKLPLLCSRDRQSKVCAHV